MGSQVNLDWFLRFWARPSAMSPEEEQDKFVSEKRLERAEIGCAPHGRLLCGDAGVNNM